MYTELTRRFKEKVDREEVNLKELSYKLGIKYDRMYKWYTGKSNPKPPDDRVIENWINGTISKLPKDANAIIKRTTAPAAIGKIEERLIRAEAYISVYKSVIAKMLSSPNDPLDFLKKEGDIDKAVEEEINNLFGK